MNKFQDIDSTRSNIVKKLYDPMTSERKIFSAWDILNKEPAEECKRPASHILKVSAVILFSVSKDAAAE